MEKPNELNEKIFKTTLRNSRVDVMLLGCTVYYGGVDNVHVIEVNN